MTEQKSEQTAKILSMEDYLRAAPEIEYESVEINDRVTMYIATLSGEDIQRFQEELESDEKKSKDGNYRMIVRALVDGIPGKTKLADGSVATGKRIGQDAHIPLWRAKPIKDTTTLVRRIMKMNGMRAKGDAKND